MLQLASQPTVTSRLSRLNMVCTRLTFRSCLRCCPVRCPMPVARPLTTLNNFQISPSISNALLRAVDTQLRRLLRLPHLFQHKALQTSTRTKPLRSYNSRPLLLETHSALHKSQTDSQSPKRQPVLRSSLLLLRAKSPRSLIRHRSRASGLPADRNALVMSPRTSEKVAAST